MPLRSTAARYGNVRRHQRHSDKESYESTAFATVRLGFDPRPTGHPAVLGTDGVWLDPPVSKRHRRELGSHPRFDNGGLMTKPMLALLGCFTLAEYALFQVPAMMHHAVDGQDTPSLPGR